MAKERPFTLYLHNISGGLDCREKQSRRDTAQELVLDDYLALYQQQLPPPDVFVLIEAHAEDTPDMDPGDGTARSDMVTKLSGGVLLPNTAVHVHSPSHLDSEKYFASAVMSRFPINGTEALLLPNPGLTYEISPGVKWESFDKKLQVTEVQTPAGPVEIAAYHGVPFHRFGRRLYTPGGGYEEFADYREEVTRTLLPRSRKNRICVGDFNNYEVDLVDAFPKLVLGGQYAQAIQLDTTRPRYHDRRQFDYIFYQPQHYDVTSAKAVPETPSDHSLLIVQFVPRRRRRR